MSARWGDTCLVSQQQINEIIKNDHTTGQSDSRARKRASHDDRRN